MPSTLTRHVFQTLLSVEMSARPTCRRMSIISRTTLPRHGPRRRRPAACAAAQRTLFGLTRQAAQPWAREPDLLPGFEQMLDLSVSESAEQRAPPARELIGAFRAFFRAKQRRGEPLQEIQAYHALRTFIYLQEAAIRNKDGIELTTKELRSARDSLVRMPQDDRSTHPKLARALYKEIERRTEKEERSDVDMAADDLLQLVAVLCQTGDTLDARELVLQRWNDGPWKDPRPIWIWIIKGFAMQKDTLELEKSLVMMERFGIRFDVELHQVITTSCASQDDVPNMRRWYERPIARGGEEAPSRRTSLECLKCCVRTDEFEFGGTVCRSLTASEPDKETWDVLLQWAAALGKGVDEVERMMLVMVKRHQDEASLRPDIQTINGLLEYAVSRRDPYAAERFMALGQKWNLAPDARTYILQIEYRIDAGDINGARVTYDKLRIGEVSSDDTIDLPIADRLLGALCADKHANEDDILTMEKDLKQRKARLEPATVAGLSLFHLRRDELRNVIGTMNEHSFHYSIEQRDVVVRAYMAFIKDGQNSTEMVWDAYTIVCHVFDEVSVERRVDLMKEFFRRGRPDMASHVFRHLRQRAGQGEGPTMDAYVQCFLGIAGAADLEALELVHNLLRLDMAIEPDTRLYNALMLAYVACDMPDRALDFWHDIASSKEGPSYQSILIALRACESSSSSASSFSSSSSPSSLSSSSSSSIVEAKKIWSRLDQIGIPINRDLAAAYVGVLAAHDQMRETSRFIGTLKNHTGIDPDIFMSVIDLLFLSSQSDF